MAFFGFKTSTHSLEILALITTAHSTAKMFSARHWRAVYIKKGDLCSKKMIILDITLLGKSTHCLDCTIIIAPRACWYFCTLFLQHKLQSMEKNINIRFFSEKIYDFSASASNKAWFSTRILSRCAKWMQRSIIEESYDHVLFQDFHKNQWLSLQDLRPTSTSTNETRVARGCKSIWHFSLLRVQYAVRHAKMME